MLALLLLDCRASVRNELMFVPLAHFYLFMIKKYQTRVVFNRRVHLATQKLSANLMSVSPLACLILTER